MQLRPQLCRMYPPLFLSLQQAFVCGNLDVQAQLGAHYLLVLLKQAGHVLLGLLQGFLQPRQLALGIIKGRLALLLRLGHCGLQLGILRAQERTRWVMVPGSLCPFPGCVQSLHPDEITPGTDLSPSKPGAP